MLSIGNVYSRRTWIFKSDTKLSNRNDFYDLFKTDRATVIFGVTGTIKKLTFDRCGIWNVCCMTYISYETNFKTQILNNTVYEWTSYNQVHQIASKLEFGPRFWEIVSNWSIRRSDWLKSRPEIWLSSNTGSPVAKNNKIKAKWKVILI